LLTRISSNRAERKHSGNCMVTALRQNVTRYTEKHPSPRSRLLILKLMELVFYTRQRIPRKIGKKALPKWIFEFWDCIVRDALQLSRKTPDWLDAPQMMRLTITTCNVLEMLGEWEIARPYNFLFLPMIDPLFGYVAPKQSDEKFFLCVLFPQNNKNGST